MQLTISKKIEESTLIFHIQGVMDYSTISDADELTQLPECINCVIVDFSELEFIDSTGIGSIIGLLHTAFEKNKDVTFRGLNDDAREVFETVGVFRIMEALRKEG
jgi:anti-anti-sigma factor